MNHCSVVGLSVDQHIAPRIAHQSATTPTAKVAGPLSTHYAPPSHLSVPLTVVETLLLLGAEASAGNIDPNKRLHQILGQDIVLELSGVDLQAHSLRILLINDESILQAPVQHECQPPMPPLPRLQGHCIISTLLINNIHTAHVLLVFQ
jgi:hypothetical protein